MLIEGGVGVYVVLVDDEQWIVTGLKKILENHYPGIRIQAFTDPREAAAHMLDETPDLLITDIRMPQLSGMELLAQMREAGLKYYAVLTGMNDVQLLQESIRIQVSDYLIKPVNKAELFALVDRVAAQLQADRERTQVRLKDHLRLCAQYGVQAADVSLMQGYRAMLLTVAAAELTGKAAEAFSFQVRLSHNGLELMLYLSEQDAEQIVETLRDVKIENALLTGFHPEQLQQQLADFDAGQKDDLSELARQFMQSEDAAAVVRQLWALLRQSECAPLALARFCRLIKRWLQLWTACYEAEGCLSGKLQPTDLMAMLQALPPLPSPHSPDVVAVLAWIEQHYKEEITLSEAAASVYLQANYFTTLFKKEMGIGFIQYLNQYRVEEACRLILLDSNMSFTQISQETGFASQRHFFATFKKYTGHPPGVFRQMLEDAGFTGN